MNASRELLSSLLKDYVDIAFANELEAEAFAGTKDMHAALDKLLQNCPIAAVKLGSKGALVGSHAVRHIGSSLTEQTWKELAAEFLSLVGG